MHKIKEGNMAVKAIKDTTKFRKLEGDSLLTKRNLRYVNRALQFNIYKNFKEY